MNFDYSEYQTAIYELAEKVFESHAGTSDNQIPAQNDSPIEQFEGELWSKLGESGLLGVAVSESNGGHGFGLAELCRVMEQYGCHVTHVPILQTAIVSMFLDKFGEQKHTELLHDAIAGRAHFTFAVEREHAPRIVDAGDGSRRISGTLSAVPYALNAAAILLAAVDDVGRMTWMLVPASNDGVCITSQECTNFEPIYRLVLDTVLTPDMVIDIPEERSDWVYQRALTLVSAVQLGVLDEALSRTAAYVSERKQFGRPIGMFQAVAHRAADAYIDIEALRSVTWQAAYLLDQDLDAAKESRVAKWWAAKAGHEVSHSVQHLHGGTGADLEYPIHRYFLWSKRMELYLGGQSHQLAEMGEELSMQMIGLGHE